MFSVIVISSKEKSAFCFEMNVHKKKTLRPKNYTLYPTICKKKMHFVTFWLLQEQSVTFSFLDQKKGIFLEPLAGKTFPHKAVRSEDPKKMGKRSQLTCAQGWMVSLACLRKNISQPPNKKKAAAGVFRVYEVFWVNAVHIHINYQNCSTKKSFQLFNQKSFWKWMW